MKTNNDDVEKEQTKVAISQSGSAESGIFIDSLIVGLEVPMLYRSQQDNYFPGSVLANSGGKTPSNTTSCSEPTFRLGRETVSGTKGSSRDFLNKDCLLEKTVFPARSETVIKASLELNLENALCVVDAAPDA